MVTLSVLMPVRNGEKYLGEAIESTLAQTFTDFELLVLDDGSSDSTRDILASYARRDPRVRVIAREQKGLVASLNELLSHAQGQFVARMDADDICLRDRFARQVQFLRDHRDVVCVGGNVDVIDDEGRFLTTFHYARDDEEIQEANLIGRTSICHPSAVMRREALLSVHGYDDEFALAEDLDLWLRLGEVGKLANVEETVLRYRFHSSSVSERASHEQLAVARAACERAWHRRGIQREFKANPWRPGPDRRSRHEHIVKFGWWAWTSGQRTTAASYAYRAIGLRPLQRDGWVLLACTIWRPLRQILDALKSHVRKS
jgi:glycosyltransferase involved in cell wall biosynthesis